MSSDDVVKARAEQKSGRSTSNQVAENAAESVVVLSDYREPLPWPRLTKLAHSNEPKIVSICDTQPVTVEGIRLLVGESTDLRFGDSFTSLDDAAKALRSPTAPSVLLLDKTLGVQAILDWLEKQRHSSASLAEKDALVSTAVGIWGVSFSDVEALRFLQAGAKGILRKTAQINVILACLRTLALGRNWMEDSVFHNGGRRPHAASDLTLREQQVLDLVEQGYKNRDIAHQLGISPGTVKIHLTHIFEKTGVRGRYELALNGLKQRRMPPAQESQPSARTAVPDAKP